MTTKRWLIATIVVLVLVIIGLISWYFWSTRARTASPTASSTSPAATTSPTDSADTVAHITEASSTYSIDLSYPSKTPLAQTASASADANAVAVMKAYVTSTQADFLQNSGVNTDFATHYAAEGGQLSVNSTYKLYTGPGTISYQFLTGEDTGGAHPNYGYKTFTFDSKTGKQLALSDLFIPGADYLTQLSTISRSQLSTGQTSADGTANTMLLDGTTPKAENFQNTVISGQSLIISFEPYQVGPYSDGAQTVTIPLSQLSDILTPSYK